MDLILYVDAFWTSPYAFSCFVALEELDLPFRVETVALHSKAQHADWYRTASLTGRIPALHHGELWLSESSAIVEYLAETFAPPAHARLLPEGVTERARARQVMAWLRSDLMPIREERPTHTIFYQPTAAPLSPAATAAAATLLRVADQVIPRDRTSLFEAWSVVDSELALMLQRLRASGHDLSPKLRAFVDAQWSRGPVRRWVERERPAYVPYL